ncbi:uncharacterized protein LOC127878150 [Dreissena polymorpha]|nr:uncharacterized protein LOC127878150 [Dreissena polymorpha]
MNTLVTTVKSYIQTKIDECKKLNEQMQDLQSEIQNTGNKTEVMSYLLYTKCVDHLATTESFLREATFRNGTTLDVEMYTAIDQTLSSFPGLGMVSKGNCIPKHTVEIRGNSFPCSISGICETANGELIVTDFSNKKVTLLNKSYTVVNKYGLPNYPWSMCRVNSNQVAIAVGDSVSKNVVLLVQAINGGLILERTEELQHRLIGIACNECFFYITSGAELFRYNMNFQNKIKIYEDNSNIQTVTACAVSSDGHRIYVVNSACDQLVTLTRDGAVLSILGDPALQLGILLPSTPGVLVTDSGKVLVCGIFSNTIIEVDKDGIQRRADFLKGKYVIRPTSVCISKITGHIIVGMYNGDVLMF